MAVAGEQRIVFNGPAAVVRLGYQKAATIGAWRIEGTRFSGRVTDVDGFRITQGPLTLEIPNPDGYVTRRRIEGVTVAGGELTGQLRAIRSEH